MKKKNEVGGEGGWSDALEQGSAGRFRAPWRAWPEAGAQQVSSGNGGGAEPTAEMIVIEN